MVAAGVLLGACGGGDDGAEVPRPSRTTEPAAYRITYDVTDGDGRVSTEEVAARRPFIAEQVLSQDGEELSFTRTAFGRLLLPNGVLAVAPAIGGADLRLVPVLTAALEEGLLELGEEKTVAGRRCRVYRAGSSVIAGELAPGGPTESSYADACFDDDGLLLEERWVVDGDLLRTKVATAVEVDELGTLGEGWDDEPTSLPGGGGAVTELDEPIATAEVPDGFDHLGTFRTEPPPIAGGRQSTSEVWTRGIDVLIVEIGEPPGGELAPLVLSLRGVEVQEALGDGRLLRVLGTLPPDEVRDVAATVDVVGAVRDE